MLSTRVDYKRELTELYRPRREPHLVEVPELGFLMIDGRGDPNTSGSYREAIETLYSVAFAVKFMLKRSEEGIDFSVMPLESLWGGGAGFGLQADKSKWRWTAMIMQPEPVELEHFEAARSELAAKKSLPALGLVRYERFAEGLAAQLLYIGAYSDEGPAIARLHEFIAGQGYAPAGRHHEIYLGDPRRCVPERLRTVIRQPARLP